MFFSAVRKEPIPERVLSICQLVADKGEITEKGLERILEPAELNTANTSYFRPIFDTAVELGLIDRNDSGRVIFTGDKNDIKTLKSFRIYCNSKVFTDPSTDFYKIISCFLSANDEWLKYGYVTTSAEVVRIINAETGIASMNLKSVILGVRFWINFLGFGYFNESSKIFLPNMYTALKDFMALGSFERRTEYSIEDFIENLDSGSSVALRNARESLTLNLAMSNALRFMHDNKEIELKNNLDSAKKWHMFLNEEHEFTSEITHIVIKEAVKR